MANASKARAPFAPWDRREIAGAFSVEETARRAGHYKWTEMKLFEALGGWIVQAQADGAIDRSLPAELVLYTLYARACDPVPLVLKAGGQYRHEEIVELVLRTCFSGLAGRPS